jgi:hypothetical protein
MILPILGRGVSVNGTTDCFVIGLFEISGNEGGFSNQVSETIS